MIGQIVAGGRLPERILYGLTTCVDDEPGSAHYEIALVLLYAALLVRQEVSCGLHTTRPAAQAVLCGQEMRLWQGLGPQPALLSPQEHAAGVAQVAGLVRQERRQVGA